jgi:hypothetical protein
MQHFSLDTPVVARLSQNDASNAVFVERADSRMGRARRPSHKKIIMHQISPVTPLHLMFFSYGRQITQIETH